MYPFGGLPENLAAFCALLRREYGFRIGAGELVDAARALEIVDLSDEKTVRAALKAVVAGSREDVVVFDAAFDRFFLSRAIWPRDQASATRREQPTGAAGGNRAHAHEPRTTNQSTDAEIAEGASRATGPKVPIEINTEEAENVPAARSMYSPVAINSQDSPEVPEVDQAWVRTARALVRRLSVGASRKWRPASKGRRFDFRRTLRLSLQIGGEPMTPRWLHHPQRQPRFIVFVDGSRSMSHDAAVALKLASALAAASSHVEVFTFSTLLQRVTTDIRRASGKTPRRLRSVAFAWNGGTAIGACLADFLSRFGERLLTSATVVVIDSDGLDVGEPEALRASMETLRRRSAALVWLNPLLDTPGYEPTALGMRTARPFVTTFTSVNDLAGFRRLSRAVSLRSRV